MLASIVGLVIGATVATGVAEADTPGNVDAVEALIREGVRLRRSGDDRGAKVEIEKAYRLARTPRTAGQLGLVEQALGQWDDAEVHLAEAIRAADDPWVHKNQAALDKALATVRAHVGALLVTGEPEGAAVLVNGRPIGTLPLREPAHVIAGEVDVEVRADGYRRHVEKVVVEKYQFRTLVVRLENVESRNRTSTAARPGALPAAAPPLALAGGPAAAPRSAAAGGPPADEPRRGSGRSTAGWILTAGGLAAMGVGGVQVLLGWSKMDDATTQATQANAAGDANMYADAQRTFSSGRTQRSVGWAVVAGGAAASVAGLVMLRTAPSAGEGTTVAGGWGASFDGKGGALSWKVRW